MTLERACQCGALYFATSGYDYSCPGCWADECIAAVRTIEWVGGAAPPGYLAIERTPITWSRAQAVDFLTGPHAARTYLAGGTFVPCLIEKLSEPWRRSLPLDWFADDDVILSHPTHQIGFRHEERLHALCDSGWWIFDTEVAWVADPTEITCDEEECCLAKRDA